MAKKTIKTEEVIVEETITLYPKGDKDLILSLFKVATPSSIQVQQILDMYRKYVNPNQPYTNGGCCGASFMMIFNNLRDWMMKNIDKFEA
jgi:hypothetical protein